MKIEPTTNVEPSPETTSTGTTRLNRQAVDKLNDANRILTEGQIMATDRPLTAREIGEVIARFDAYLEANDDLSLAKVAKQIGYSSAVLSEWRAGEYRGNIEKVCRAVNDWLERDARRKDARKDKGFINTWIADSIRSYAYIADKRCMMAAIVAPAGSGKTMLLKVLAADMRGLLVTVYEKMNIGDLYRAVAEPLGYTNVKRGSRGELLKFIVEKLSGSSRIIFLDEAQHLGANIGAVRAIHDMAGVPIVLAGTADILNLVNDRSHGRGQFSSRCLRFNAMEFVQNADDPRSDDAGRPLFSMAEIQEFFAGRKIRLDREAMKLVWALACLPDYGCLRLIGNLVDIATDAEPGIALITRDHIIGAMQSVMGGESAYLARLAQHRIGSAADEKATALKAG